LKKPDGCSDILWEIISQCFQERTSRPTFSVLLGLFKIYSTSQSRSVSKHYDSVIQNAHEIDYNLLDNLNTYATEELNNDGLEFTLNMEIS